MPGTATARKTALNCPTPTKRFYQDRAAAEDAAAAMTEQFGVRMHIYGCECGRFHLTSGQRPFRKNRPTSSLPPEAKRRKRLNWKANRRARRAAPESADT